MTGRKITSELAATIALKGSLVADGWRTPDTYGNEFAPVPNSAGVYLFLHYSDELFHCAKVAYVGMSIDVDRRWAGHEILRSLSKHGRWTQRWFKPARASDLRHVEASYIVKFNPPWNIIGRQRGFAQ